MTEYKHMNFKMTKDEHADLKFVADWLGVRVYEPVGMMAKHFAKLVRRQTVGGQEVAWNSLIKEEDQLVES